MKRDALVWLLVALVCGCRPRLEEEQRLGGHFRALQAFADPDGSWAAALGDRGAEPSELTVVSLGDGASCTAGPADSFFAVRGEGRRMGLLTWHGSDEACGTLSAVDTRCRRTMAPRACSPRPDAVRDSVFGGRYSRYVVVEADGILTLIDPWGSDALELGRGVRAWRWADADSAWVHEEDRLVVRHLDGAPERIVASGVGEVALNAQGAAAYVDAEGAWLVDSPSASPRAIAPGGCRIRSHRDGRRFALLAPCAEGRLVLYDPAGADSEPLADAVAAFRADTLPIYVLRGSPGASEPTRGELFAVRAGKEPVLVASDAELASARRIQSEQGEAHLVLAGSDRKLLRVAASGTTTLWSGVDAFEARHDHVVALSLADSRTGTLLLAEETEDALQALAGGVPLDGFVFADQLAALGFIRDHDGVAGTLEVIIFTTGDRGVVDENVSEVAEVRSETLPGLAYLIARGERAGIWFAEPTY